MPARRFMAAIALACIIRPDVFVCAAAGEKSAREKLVALQKEHKDAEAAFRKAVEPLGDDDRGRKSAANLWKAFDDAQGKRFADAVDIAKADPKADVAVAALEWVLTIPRSYYHPAGRAAMEEVTRCHAANPNVGKLVSWVGQYAPHDKLYPKEAAAAWAMIDAVAKDNSDKTVRAQAYLAKACKVKALHTIAEYRSQPDAEGLAVNAEAAFEALVKEYGACPWLIRENSGTVGEYAKRELFEIRHLRVGKAAPEIEAEGVDGKRFKLSDYRGKVVAVIFWASWCGPCMADVPHEREMMERLKGRPFVIVAVNGDDKREKAIETMEKHNMTWPSFWNGSAGPKGAISTAWNVQSWPTVYVLDPKGIIRFKGARGKDLEEKVTSLLDEVKAEKSKK